MDFLYLTIVLVLSFAVFILGFFLFKKKQTDHTANNDTSNEVKNQLTNQIHELDKQKAILEDRIQNSIKKFNEQQEEVQKYIKLTDQLKEENITLKAINDTHNEKLTKQKEEIDALQKKFTMEFENIANKILKQNSSEFVHINEKKIGEILNPLKEKLNSFEEKVQGTYEKGLKERSVLAEQIKSLSELNLQMQSDAKNLTNALKGDSKTQGNWGEIQLEMILNKAGLEKDIHYTKEENIKTESGANQRLDYIIKLPDNKRLIIDSKVSLTAYANYYNEEEKALKEKYFKDHLDSIYTHINLLSNKNYQNLDIVQPDYVLMFLANEPALTSALKKDEKLFEKALGKNIVLVSSSTLLATLRTISYIWKTDLQNKNAKEIASQAGRLYEKFIGFSRDLMDVGKKLDSAAKSYDSAMNKLSDGRGNLIRQVETLKKLGAATSNSIDSSLLEKSEDE